MNEQIVGIVLPIVPDESCLFSNIIDSKVVATIYG